LIGGKTPLMGRASGPSISVKNVIILAESLLLG